MNTYQYVDSSGNVQTVQAESPQAAIAAAPNIASNSGVMLMPQQQNAQSNQQSNSNTPSSSSSYLVNQNVQSSINAANNPQPPVAPANANEQFMMNYYGVDLNTVRNRYKDDPFALAEAAKTIQQNQQSKQEQLNAQNAQYAAQLGLQNQQYAEASAEIARQREAAQNTAKTQSYAANPFAATSSAATGYASAIDSKYGRLQATLTAQAQAAAQAAAAGNSEAVAAINANMAKLTQQGLAQINSELADLRKSNQQAAQFQMNFDESKRQFDTNQQNIWADNAMNFLTKLNYDPKQIDQLIESGDIQTDPTYQSFLKAGLSPEGALTAMKAGSIAQANLKLQQDRLIQAQINAANSQAMIGTWSLQTDPATGAMYRFNSKTGNMMPVDSSSMATTFGGGTVPTYVSDNFIKGIQNISTAGGVTTQEKAAAYSSINGYLSAGDTDQARVALKNYATNSLSQSSQDMVAGMNTLKSNLAMIQKDIDSLPAGVKTNFLSGNFEKGLQMVGLTNSYLAAKLKNEIETAKFAYINQISGKQFTDKERNAYGQVFPSITNTESLNFAKLSGLYSTVNSTLNSIYQQRIGQEVYNNIYSQQSGGQNSTSTTAAPKVGDIKTYQGATYKFNGTNWVKQ